jgi:chaperonin GroEL
MALIKGRIAQIDASMKKMNASYDKEKAAERKAKLQGGVAVIHVGAMTETEMKKQKQVFEDSLNATRAAIEAGVVLGGGMALLNAARSIKAPAMDATEWVGYNIVLKACEAPFRQIVQNTGYDPSTYLGDVLAKGKHFGFNALTGQIEDLWHAGILDPAKVTSSCLSHAVSMAVMVLMSETLIAPAVYTARD